MKYNSLFSSIFLSLLVSATICPSVMKAQGRKYNFGTDWKYSYEGKIHQVTLPHAWNEDQAFAVPIGGLKGDTVLYEKDFRLSSADLPQGGHVFIEFEGVRQAADVWINGHYLGYSENGVMAFGFELTPFLLPGNNHIEVLTNSSWYYQERESGAGIQWNHKSFNANYGGINRGVNLYVKGPVYQTLPLYSNLGTTGVYIYGSDYDISRRKATVHVESQVANTGNSARRLRLQTIVTDVEGKQVAFFEGRSVMADAGAMVTLTAEKRLSDLHFWSWGYGYLYNVTTRVMDGGNCLDETVTRTGFRKTSFREGKIFLNDRAILMHGYAQRSTNEWPAVGINIPAWMSDYSNRLMVQSGANLVRWMHVTPSRQEVESCDRVGLIQALPAGDSEKDVTGRQWTARTEVMRDAMIYLRNSPSILFWEGGNESISAEHVVELKALRDRFDPHGGRAVGSREMLDIDESEYGGEMLYINKSAGKPLWAMEYSRDEAYRLYWDEYSYPWHHSGMGPLTKKQPATSYNRNQDDFAVEMVRRWYDFWRERPGSGRRVSAGGVKIIFTDTNTHGRSEFSQRVSGAADAMRIPKDAYYVHQVMWDSWLDIEHHATYIVGHWNYEDGIRKPVYVVSTSPIVELSINGTLVGRSEITDYDFLHTFPDVEWLSGTLTAVGYSADGLTEESRCSKETTGRPAALKLSLVNDLDRPIMADGLDMALVQVEVVDNRGRRCPVDNRTIHWSLKGPAQWRGGLAKSPDRDNHILDYDLPVECGVNRVLVRSLDTPGIVTLQAEAKGLASATISWETQPFVSRDGLATTFSSDGLSCYLERGETPSGVSYRDRVRTVDIASARAGANQERAAQSFDDNELSEWTNDGRLQTAWITYTLSEDAAIDDVCLKLTGWRQRSYPLEILAGDQVVWSGQTEKSLGYVHLKINNPHKARTYTIRQIGAASDKEAFGQIVEVSAAAAGELDMYRTPDSEKVRGELRIIEVDFNQTIE